MLNLQELENKLDDSLNKESKESLLNWLNMRNAQIHNDETIAGNDRFHIEKCGENLHIPFFTSGEAEAVAVWADQIVHVATIQMKKEIEEMRLHAFYQLIKRLEKAKTIGDLPDEVELEKLQLQLTFVNQNGEEDVTWLQNLTNNHDYKSFVVIYDLYKGLGDEDYYFVFGFESNSVLHNSLILTPIFISQHENQE